MALYSSNKGYTGRIKIVKNSSNLDYGLTLNQTWFSSNTITTPPSPSSFTFLQSCNQLTQMYTHTCTYLLNIQWLLADNLVSILSINPVPLLTSLWSEMHPTCPCTCRKHDAKTIILITALYMYIVHVHAHPNNMLT